jgi:peptide/nickel transport system permease protein
VVTLFAISVIVFVLMQNTGGSPIDRLKGNPRMIPLIPMLTEHFGLDRPQPEQYIKWLRNFITPIPVVQENGYAIFGSYGIKGVWPFVGLGAAIIATAGLFLARVREDWWPRVRNFSVAGVWVAALAFLVASADKVGAQVPLDSGVSADGFIPVWRVGLKNWIPIAILAVAIAYTIAVFVAKVDRAWWRSFRVFSSMGVWALALWLIHARIVFALNWSQSFRGDGPVWDTIMGAVGATFRLGFAALLLALIIGIPLGIYQATRQYSFFDQVGTFSAFVTFSTPIFIIGIVLQVLLAHYLTLWTGVKVFYTTGMTGTQYAGLESGPLGLPSLAQFGDVIQHLTLPALSIALISIAGYSRFQRASMLEVLHSDYLRTAKAKGLPRRTIVLKHALRNALIPIITLVSLDIAFIAGGAIITESVFGWPGIGRRYIDAIRSIDYPTVMAVVMIIGAGIVVMNIVADILYGVLDPRVRYD